MIRFSGRLDPALCRRAHRLALGGVLPLWAVYALVAGALAVGLVAFLRFERLVAGALAFSLGVLGALVLALYEVAVRRAGKTRRLAPGPFEGTVDEDALRVSAPGGPSEVPWQDFRRWKGSRSLLLLYLSPRHYQVLARSFFPAPADWHAARRLVARKVPGGQGGERRRLLWIFLFWFLLLLVATLAFAGEAALTSHGLTA